MKMKKWGALFAGLAVGAALSQASAAEYPNKAINVLVGFSAGGGTDVYARNLGVTISKYLNDQPFVVVNKAGGAQVPALKVLKSSAPDGYSLMITSLGSAIIAAGLRDQGVDVFRDFEFVAQYGVTNIMLTASLQSGFKTPQEVIAGIKKANAEGRKLRWGNTGRSSITSLAAIAWLNKNGVYDMTQDVPFKGGSKARAAIIGNNIDFAIFGSSNASAYKDKFNIIGVFSESRDPAQPDIPTLTDLGTPHVPMETPIVILAPKGTPKDVIATLNAAVKKTTDDPEFKERSAKAGQSVVYRSTAEVVPFAAKLKKEWDDTIKVVRKRIAETKN
jgi:tripartite-type tricarboxylate transporter receptor subunit TctC